MTAPSASQPAPEQLAAALAPALGASVEIDGLQRLTGGASRETWSFRANGEELILRRDPPRRANAPHVMQLEADAMRACQRAGLRVPEVLVHDDGTLLGTAGLVMRRVPGETIPRRILRDDAFAGARDVLVGDLGHFLGGFHSIDPAEVPGVADRDVTKGIWQTYERFDDTSRVFEKTYDWLLEQEPPRSATTLVHGDLRLGNIIVGPSGLEAVIDWELVHLGDPLEDLAWLCIKAWRFGGPFDVAGLGTIDELIGAYEAAGGKPVDRDALHWWLVNRTLLWGIGCMAQGATHLSGAVRSVDLAATGRRAAEQEWDLVELLAPDAARAALAAPPAPARPETTAYGRPTARELLASVREFLPYAFVLAGGAHAYHARVAANILGTIDRELAQEPVVRDGDDWDTLALAVRDRVAVVNPKHLILSTER